MPNWTESMQQTFEYYVVDPITFKDTKPLKNIISSSISRDSSADTLGSASFSTTEMLGECYIRIYLVAIQNGIKERFPLGTYLVQTPSFSFDGKVKKSSLNAYTPLMELKENYPPIGYFINSGSNIMSNAVDLLRKACRAKVLDVDDDSTIPYNFIAETEDTWLSYISSLISNAKYSLDLDEMGKIIFAKKQDIASLQPVWTYTDDNSSILHPDQSMERDLYGIPNVVEVIYSNGSVNLHITVENNDPNSPTSTISRGRKITYRDTSPEVTGTPSLKQLEEYANQLLRNLSTIEYSISYTHGYCPVRVGDCVRINSKRAGLTDVKAKVVTQKIKCEPGCPVSEKAVFTKKLWR